MKRFLLSLLALAAFPALLLPACAPKAAEVETPRPLVLHYDRPAEFFEEALPIGNGRIGAMVYGGTDEAVFTLNDITLWTGEPDRGMDHPDVAGRDYAGAVEAVRAALEAEDYALAERLQTRLQGHYSETYQPLGTLRIAFDGAPVSDYRRELNISDATARVSYLRDGEPFTMEAFASAPDSAIVIRLRHAPGIHARISFESPQPGALSASDGRLTYDGYTAYHAYPGYYRSGEGQFLYDPDRGIHFRTVVSVAAESRSGRGVLQACRPPRTAGRCLRRPKIRLAEPLCPEAGGSEIAISGEAEVTIYIVNATSFNGFDRDPVREGKPYQTLANANADRAMGESYESLLERHTSDYRIATTLPPFSPPSGPISITQSAHLIISILCSMMRIEWPRLIRASKHSSNFLISWKCKPVVGSSKMNSVGSFFSILK